MDEVVSKLIDALIPKADQPQFRINRPYERSEWLRVESFDECAKVELALPLRSARKAGDEREGLTLTRYVLDFDRQIAAIALVGGAKIPYSDDKRVAKFAASCGLATKRVIDLPTPPFQNIIDFPGRNPVLPPTGGDQLDSKNFRSHLDLV